MKKLLNSLRSKDSKYIYMEIIGVILILLILIAVAVPSYIRKIDNSRKETDKTNATLIGNAVIKIINQENRFTNYSVTKLNVNKDKPSKSQSLDEYLIEELTKEFEKFNIHKIPPLKYKKGGYEHFSVTVDKGNVTVFADNKKDSKKLLLFSGEMK